ncbi:hypothetical protein [Rhodobacter sp. JA431]|uniref:hypothetical protein n=1 Tax=Rhodobacter sp. JA431 TaxID=570013 RepID=UPI00148285B1|nr:hypothetical protein [Rhodobacter sp. JA431]
MQKIAAPVKQTHHTQRKMLIIMTIAKQACGGTPACDGVAQPSSGRQIAKPDTPAALSRGANCDKPSSKIGKR